MNSSDWNRNTDSRGGTPAEQVSRQAPYCPCPPGVQY